VLHQQAADDRSGRRGRTEDRPDADGAAFLASREWREKGSSGSEVMAAAFDAYADQLTAALAGHWS